MNIALWVLQVVLALHTLMGAVWKLSNPVPVPSLAAIGRSGWRSLVVPEVVCAVGLVLPAFTSLGVAAPVAAGVVALEMLGFVLVHRRSGVDEPAQVSYWTGVAVLCALIVVGRVVVPL